MEEGILWRNGFDGKVLRCAVDVRVDMASDWPVQCSKYIHQPPPFKGEPNDTQDLRRRTEIIPVKDSHSPHQNRTVVFDEPPRPLHNRYTRTGNCVR